MSTLEQLQKDAKRIKSPSVLFSKHSDLFNVSLARAKAWLKQHNTFYEDIETGKPQSYEKLQELRKEGEAIKFNLK